MQTVPIYARCWIWLGPKDNTGYGVTRNKDKVRKRIHIMVYEQFFGKVGSFYELHHECENRACYNPFHLAKLTKREHRQITDSKITHCPQGHPYDATNTYYYHGHRQCKICRKKRNDNRY